MKTLAIQSGPWAGFWIQNGSRGAMRLNLHFSAISVAGAGWDRSGPFTLQGTFSTEGVVKFTKRYPTHSVYYRGIWNGAMITGMWAIHHEGDIDTGEFEIWPESDELALTELNDTSQLYLLR